MRTSFNRRLSMLTVALIVVGILLLVRLASFQFQLDTASYLQNKGSNSYRQLRDQIPDRGRIYDRNMELLATNMMEYDIAISPNLVTDKASVMRGRLMPLKNPSWPHSATPRGAHSMRGIQ